MKAYLYKFDTPTTYQWLFFEVTRPYGEDGGALVNVYECDEIEWAEQQPEGKLHTIAEPDLTDGADNPDEAWIRPDFYLSVNVWEKYFFPKFDNQYPDCNYQMYSEGDIDVLAWAMKKCIALAKEKAGVVLGSR